MFRTLSRRTLVVVPACLLLFIVAGGVAQAQYFGRNKVQYDDFDFKVLETPHFKIYYYPEERDVVRIAARLAERWDARHEVILGHTLSGSQPLVLYASQPQFEENNIVGSLGVGVGGVTEPIKRRIILPFAGPLNETNHVIGHELVHAFQYDIAGAGGSSLGGSAVEKLPLWFIEGMAEYLSLGPDDPNTAMWMREAVRNKKLPSFSDLNGSDYFPYRYGQALLAYVGGRWGNKKIGDLLKFAGKKGDIHTAIDSVLSIKPDSLIKAWHVSLHTEYDSLLSRTRLPDSYGPVLISKKSGGGSLNVSPVLSPDGRQLAFFSERDLFSIDLFLADAATGKIKRNIFKAELDPHYQSLEFINSTGAWDPGGNRFVFSAVSKGRPVLTIVSVESGEVIENIPFKNLDEVFDPAWSPDGRFIVFSALNHGFSDLFLYNIETKSRTRLTDDAYADFQPAWSPDGKQIAFVTDRFTTNLSDLAIGNYTLAVMDVGTRTIHQLKSFSDGKNIDPQWSPDGKSVFFVSDRNGISNIYQLHLQEDTVSQLTNLYSGASGITPTSPALSVAMNSGKIVYSVFENGNYSIYACDSLNKPVIASHRSLTPDPALLTQSVQPGDSLLTLLHDPAIGRTPDSSDHIEPYHSTLSLSGISGVSVGTGVDPFGTYLGGGATLLWSDMLGSENLATALQVQSSGSITDIAALAAYENTAHRLYWGGAVEQVPYITGGYATGYGTVNGEPAYIEQDYLYREINREVSGILAYPFSEVLRTEFSAGYRNITFRQQVETIAISLNTGLGILDNTQDLPAPSALNLGAFSSALVYDNSIMGATDPVLGSRYRLQISPNVGSLAWFDVLADYRKYFLPVRPFTLAFRMLHYGRYGGGAEDYRLSPLYLGYPGLVRGYDVNTFSASEVAGTPGGNVFDKIQGSKLLIGNFELRFPLLGALGLGEGYYGFLPIEMAGFFDAGVAWQNDDGLWLFGGNRTPVSSTGGALRINLFGLVGEVDYIHPFNRPGKNWLWQFNLVEGI